MFGQQYTNMSNIVYLKIDFALRYKIMCLNPDKKFGKRIYSPFHHLMQKERIQQNKCSWETEKNKIQRRNIDLSGKSAADDEEYL